jgi:hypothetical protein
MRTRALQLIVPAALTARMVMGAAHLLRSDLRDTSGVCGLHVMRTGGLGDFFLPYCLDGKPLLKVPRAALLMVPRAHRWWPAHSERFHHRCGTATTLDAAWEVKVEVGLALLGNRKMGRPCDRVGDGAH